MKKFFTFFVALVVTSAVMAGNVITYTANWKLSEVSNEMICGDFGLHVDAFNVSIVSHTFSDGVGTIVFSGDVTSVGYQAFAYSSGLTSVTIPESVTSIGDYAFLECPNLTTLAIPNEVTSIGNNAFCKVNNIAYSGTASGAPWGAKCVNGYVEDELVYPDADKTAVVGCFTSAKGAISIPESVTRIGHDAFYNCTGVTSITIPEGVTSIGPSAFLLCTHLRSIVIPKGVTVIASDLFVGCLLLESVTLPEGVERLGSGVFADCTSLKELRVEAVNPPLVSPDAGTFSSVSKYIPVYVPAGSIDSYKAATGWKEFTNYQAIFYFPLNQEWKFLQETYCEEGWDKKVVVSTFGDTIDIADVTYYSFDGYYFRSEGNKIFYHVSNEMPDVVLYDFDLQVGDSLMFFQDAFPSGMLDPENTTYSVVTKVDTVTLMDSRRARRLHYDNRAVDIEYMGSVYGLLEPLHMSIPTCMNITLLCVSVDNEPIYETSAGACDIELKDTVELKGEYREFNSLLWEGEIVFPGVDPGIKTEDGKEYYLFYNDMFPCMLTEGDPIRVKAVVSEEHDLRGVPYNKAEVLEWIDHPCKTHADEWNVLRFRGGMGEEPFLEATTLVYTLSGDISLGAYPPYQWIVIEKSGTSEKAICSLHKEGNQAYVYINNQEYLLYDFDAKVGESRSIYSGLSYSPGAFKNTITDIQIREDGLREFSVEIDLPYNEKGYCTWIEGIGSTMGLLYTAPGMPGDFSYNLQCAYSSGECIFITSYESYASLGCMFNTSLEEAKSTQDKNVRRYIINGQLVIDVNGVRYDALGKMLK